MDVFVSGATGFIGSHLVKTLANRGHNIHALYRSESKTGNLIHPNIRLFKGDILNIKSLEKAMEGCVQAYHVAAFTNIWNKDPSVIYKLNIEGTMNVLHAAIQNNVKRIVCTSTAGVIGPSGDKLICEESPPPESFFIDYESSKAILEKILETLSLSGPEFIIVNPTRVYGPGLLSESNSVTRMIDKYIRGKWRFIPGNGRSIGNYVHVMDVVKGHILAMEKGKNGERYLLGGENVTYTEFFKTLSEVAGKKHLMLKIPLWIMLCITYLIMLKTHALGSNPIITPSLVRKFNHNFNISSSKAIRDLGYDAINLRKGLEDTVEWLNKR